MPTPGPLELVIILVIALLILGPGKLPEVGAALGKSIREFRKASSDVQDAVNVNVDTSPLPASPAPAPAGRTGRRRRAGRRRGRGAGRRARTGRAGRRRRGRRSLADARPTAASRRPAGRLVHRRQLAGRHRTRPWPTPTPCASRASPGSRRIRPPPGRPRPADETVMSLVDHLGELRTRLFRSILAVAVGVGHRVLLRDRRSASSCQPAARRASRSRSSASATRSSSRSRSRSSSGSSWRCRSCSTSSGRSSRRA